MLGRSLPEGLGHPMIMFLLSAFIALFAPAAPRTAPADVVGPIGEVAATIPTPAATVIPLDVVGPIGESVPPAAPDAIARRAVAGPR